MHPQRILLTGGRAFVTLDLARQFARAGHTVFVAESTSVHLCRYSRSVQDNFLLPSPNQEPHAYLDALLAIISRERINLLLPTCEEAFWISQGLARLQPHCHVCVAPFGQMHRLHSKWHFIQAAQAYGLSVPATHLLTSHADLEDFTHSHTGAFIFKPVYSRFGTQVVITEHVHDALAQSAHWHISSHSPWIAQQRVSGQAFCSYSLAHRGQLLAHVVYPVSYTANGGATIYFESVQQPAIDAWIRHFVSCEAFSGQIAFDFIVTASGQVYPLECNPRATSGVHLFNTDDQLVQSFINPDATAHTTITPPPDQPRMIAIAMLAYGPPWQRFWQRGRAWWHHFWHARDVIWDRHDWRPFLVQPYLLWFNWRESRKRGLSLLAYTTADIEWNGPSHQNTKKRNTQL